MRGMTVILNEWNELIQIRLVTGWRAYVDYQKLDAWTENDYFPMLFMDRMIDRLQENDGTVFLMVFGVQSFLYCIREPRGNNLYL